MNLILVEDTARQLVWAPDDQRARHVREVLRMKPGDVFFVGAINGPRGKARWLDREGQAMVLEVTWEPDTMPSRPLILLVGLPRPQTARRILFEAAVFGVRELVFFQSERGEPSYRQSSLWSDGEWERLLHRGAEQAFATRLPDVQHRATLPEALAGLDFPTTWDKIALDVYEAEDSLGNTLQGTGAVLALGAERGWSPAERGALRQGGYRLAGLGERVLRTETACVAAMSVTLRHLGLM